MDVICFGTINLLIKTRAAKKEWMNGGRPQTKNPLYKQGVYRIGNALLFADPVL